MGDRDISRRETLAAGVAVGSSALGIGLFLTSGAESENATKLAVSSSIPLTASIWVTVSERHPSGNIISERIRLRGGDYRQRLDTIDGHPDSEYVFEIELGSNGDSPELDTLSLEAAG